MTTFARFFPLLILVLAVGYLYSKLRPPEAKAGEMQMGEFGKLPVIQLQQRVACIAVKLTAKAGLSPGHHVRVQRGVVGDPSDPRLLTGHLQPEMGKHRIRIHEQIDKDHHLLRTRRNLAEFWPGTRTMRKEKAFQKFRRRAGDEVNRIKLHDLRSCLRRD